MSYRPSPPAEIQTTRRIEKKGSTQHHQQPFQKKSNITMFLIQLIKQLTRATMVVFSVNWSHFNWFNATKSLDLVNKSSHKLIFSTSMLLREVKTTIFRLTNNIVATTKKGIDFKPINWVTSWWLLLKCY